MNVTDIVADRLITRGIYLERYKAGFNNRILAVLLELENNLTKELSDLFQRGITSQSARSRRLESLLSQTRQVIHRTYTETNRISGKELLRLAENEQKYVVDAINRAAAIEIADVTLDYEQLKKLTNGTLIQGAPLSDWWNRQGEDLQRRFGDQMRMGVLRGENLDQLTARVRGTQARAYTDGVMQTSRRHAEAIAHTAVQAVANATRDALYDANSDIISAIQWISVLDQRTTHICKALSNKLWTVPDHRPIGHEFEFPEKAPHVRCRSTRLPVLKKWEDLVAGQGEEEIDEEFKRQLREDGFTDEQIAKVKLNARAAADGQVAADISFEDWLKDKPPEFQDKLLGKGRGKLFRDGKITMTDLVDQRLRPLTLAELEALPQPRPGPTPVKLPIKRPHRTIKDTVPSAPGPAPLSAPLVVHTATLPVRSSPVSAGLRVPSDAVRAPSYAATLRVIDSVHDDGALPTIPFIETKATVNVGEYVWWGKAGAADKMHVSRLGPHPELTLVHEVGHFIDHQALDWRGTFASEKSDLLEVWRKIVMSTQTYKAIKAGAAGKKINGKWPRRSPAEFAEALRFRELWARAYTQYIVSHGQNAQLKAQFEVAARHLQGLYFWTDEEFTAIDLAITTLLTAKSWLTQT